MAFRDEFGDPAAASAFSNHVGIAEDLLERIERIPAEVKQIGTVAAVTQTAIDAFAQEWARGWQDVWAQLREARAIVLKQGRDTREFDAALASAGDLYFDVAGGKATRVGNEVTVSWKNVPTQPAKDAIAALRAVMREVVVVNQAPVEMDIQPRNKLLVILGAVALIALFVYLVATG